MNMTMRSTSDVRWLTPVYVRIGYGSAEAVRSPQQALDKLMYRWPANQGRHYLSAKANCRAALDQKISPDIAREAFVRASLEAKLLD